MVFWSLMHILTLLLDIIAVLGVTNGDKNLEIIILRQQVRILQRNLKSAPYDLRKTIALRAMIGEKWRGVDLNH